MKRFYVLLALVFAACPPQPTPPPDAGEEPTCDSREQCDAGMICAAENYCTTCTSSGQCSVKEVCHTESRLCVLREGWGNDCVTNDNCQLGRWCKQGLCLQRSEVSLCESGLNSDCPQGERCNKNTFVCEEDLGCSTDFDCSAGEACNTGSRQCQQRCTEETQGEICPAGTRCIGEICRQCEADAECGVGLTCDVAGNCSTSSRCYNDRDCPVPLVCLPQTGACLAKAPACRSDDNCAANQRCDVSNGRCIPRACQPDVYEPNNDDAHAYGITPGLYRDLTLCPGDVDWYSVNLARGDQLGINIDADPFSENNFSCVVKDPTGRTVAGGRFLTSYVAPVQASYYVVISTIDDYQPYGINILKSRGTPCDDDNLEPNDTMETATPLGTTVLANGRVCPQDQDWFRATVPVGATQVRASLIGYTPSQGLLRLCMFRNDGVTQAGCTDGTTLDGGLPFIQATAATIGATVVVRVVGTSEQIANSYTLSLEFP